MRISVWPGIKLSVWERQNPEALRVTMSNTTMRGPVRRILSKRGWAVLLVRHDWKKSGRYCPADEPTAPVEPPITFVAPSSMPEAELEELQRRAHP